MTKPTLQNGQAEYGIRHVDEEAMRSAEQGVFEPHSSEAGAKRAAKTADAPAKAPAKRKGK